MKTIAERAHNIIATHLGIEPKKVVDSAHLTQDLGADSLDRIELVMGAEEEFKCIINDDQSEKIVTVGDYVRACSGEKL